MSIEPDVVRLLPERKRCGVCRRKLRVRKTRERTVRTLAGEVRVKEVVLYCPRHPDRVFKAGGQMAPRGSSYGFDLIAKIGRLRYQEHKQVGEIRDEVRLCGARIPRRTVQWLCDRFLEFVVAVHLESMPLLADMFAEEGGYVLHVDGTGTSGKTVLLFREGWTGITLLAAPVAGEGEESVSPLLELLNARFGPPVAVVRDMSKGIDAAIHEVFPGTYVITCHYHFLRDVGLKLFEPLYKHFRNRVDRRGVKKRLKALRRALRGSKFPTEEKSTALELVEHILSFPKDGGGLAFPFTLPAVDFYRRCEDVARKVRKEILSGARENRSSPFLSRLENALRLLKPPPAVLGRLNSDFLALGERWKWFQRVRRALRYRNGPVPLSTQITLSEDELEKGREKIDQVRRKMDEFCGKGGGGHHEREMRRALRKVFRLIDEHRDSLLAPNVAVTVKGRNVVRELPRTNAPVEMEYRTLRRHGRRITGNGDVEPQVQREGAGMLIAQNLSKRRYVSAVYGSTERIAKRLSKVSPESLRLAKSLLRDHHASHGERNHRLPQ